MSTKEAPVERGGRHKPEALLAQERKAREAQERELQERMADVRQLLHRPEFLRYIRFWIAQCGTFTKPPRVFSPEKHVLDGRKEVGVEMWNELMAADPRKVIDLLDITTDSQET